MHTPTLLENGLLLSSRFRIEERIGRGGIGEVWRAADLMRGAEPVACKILRADIPDQRVAAGFLKREVLVSRRLHHPGIVTVYSYFESESIRFITMEYIEGDNLARLLAARPDSFSVGEVLRWLEGVCLALDYAHGQGVLHRDIKPENLLIRTGDGSVHIVDFGLAEADLGEEAAPDRSEVRGTLAYMSPEILMNGRVTAQCDQYSLAVTVYEMLSGATPFQAGEVVAQIAVKPPLPISHLSEQINRVLLRALAKSPERRFTACADFFNALRLAAFGKLTERSRGTQKGDVADPRRETAMLGGFEVPTRRTRLGRMLLETNAIDQDQLAEALIRQLSAGEKLGQALIALGYLSDASLCQALATQLQIPPVDDNFAVVDAELIRMAGLDKLREYAAIPLHRTPYGVVVAMADPLDMEALNHLEGAFGESIDPVVGTYSGIELALRSLG